MQERVLTTISLLSPFGVAGIRMILPSSQIRQIIISGRVIGGSYIMEFIDRLCFQISKDKDLSIMVYRDVVDGEEVINDGMLR